MTIIANPIYDSVFKYMMEDNRVAKILLSALLQKEIVRLEMRPHEFAAPQRSQISLYRIDFSAVIRNADGTENLILIELQKTWLSTETLRFRQYLGIQYLNQGNILPKHDNPDGYGLPLVSIYILGHKLGDLKEPVVYVRRNYLDYDSNLITEGVPDRFIESLTHDSIIVQIPYLKGRMRNRLERLLQVFDQAYCLKDDEHFLEIDDEELDDNDERLVVYRLVKAAAAPDVRRAMDIEDEILSEIEARDTAIMQKDEEIERKSKEIERKDEEIERKSKEIERKDEEIECKSKEIECKSKEIERKDEEIECKSKEIERKDEEIECKSKEIERKDEEIERKDKALEEKDNMLRSLVRMLREQGLPACDIARQLHMEETEVLKWMEEKK